MVIRDKECKLDRINSGKSLKNSNKTKLVGGGHHIILDIQFSTHKEMVKYDSFKGEEKQPVETLPVNAH